MLGTYKSFSNLPSSPLFLLPIHPFGISYHFHPLFPRSLFKLITLLLTQRFYYCILLVGSDDSCILFLELSYTSFCFGNVDIVE